MRLTQVLVVIATSFLAISDAHSATNNANQVQITKAASPGAPTQRLLRAHPMTDHEEDENEDGLDDSYEERVLGSGEVTKILGKLGVTMDDILKKPEVFAKYQEQVNKVIAKQKSAKNKLTRIIKRDHTL